MAQGAIKVSKKPAGPARKGVAGPKRGARTIAPKKTALVKNAKAAKKLSAGMTAMTERALGAKAGHLELLKVGKNDKSKKEKQSAGSRKFG